MDVGILSGKTLRVAIGHVGGALFGVQQSARLNKDFSQIRLVPIFIGQAKTPG